MEWHLKSAAEAVKRNDANEARDHTSRAKSYKAKGDEYMNDAKRCTKKLMCYGLE